MLSMLAPSTEYMLSPERYEGHLLIEEIRIPFVATISADFTGRLRLEVEPIAFEGRSSDLVKLMQTGGRPGTTMDEFQVECSSSSGKRIESDGGYLTSFQHRNHALEIGLALSQATLHMPLASPRSAPALCYWLRGFRSFGPGLLAETPLGTVQALGATELESPDQISGRIVIQAKDGAATEHWREDADDLLMHLRMALSFANGGSLTTPAVQYALGEQAEVIFYRTSVSGTAELPVQPFLNLEPFFKSVALNFESARCHRDALANSIGWLLVETTHDEVRFLTGMTALESLASHHLPAIAQRLLDPEIFGKVESDLTAAIDASSAINSSVKSALKAKLRGLNRPSLVKNIKALFKQWGVSRADISDGALRRLVGTRNDIVHRGLAQDDDALWDLIVTIREIIGRFVMTMLRFEGTYECYLGGQHMRYFPTCKRIPNPNSQHVARE